MVNKWLLGDAETITIKIPEFHVIAQLAFIVCRPVSNLLALFSTQKFYVGNVRMCEPRQSCCNLYQAQSIHLVRRSKL